METIHKAHNFRSDNTIISVLQNCVNTFLGPLRGHNVTLNLFICDNGEKLVSEKLFRKKNKAKKKMFSTVSFILLSANLNVS